MYTYRQIPDNKWREKLTRILNTDKPLFFTRIDTTGLDADKCEMIGISILKCEWKDGILVKTGMYDSLIHTNAYITPFITELTGIKHSDLAIAPDINTVMSQVREFLEKDAYILAFNTQFLGSFLSKYSLPIALTFDINVMSQALMAGHQGYKYLIREFNTQSPARIFEHLIERYPLGTIKGIDKDVICDQIRFNGSDIITENKDIFDELDPDYLWEILR